MNSDLTIIETFTSKQDLYIAQGLLRSNGIECYTADENLDIIIGTPVVEGYKLQVHKNDEQRAKKIISARKDHARIESNTSPRRLLYTLTTLVAVAAIFAAALRMTALNEEYYNLNNADRYLGILAICANISLLIGCAGVVAIKRWGWVVLTTTLAYVFLEFSTGDLREYFDDLQRTIAAIITIVLIASVWAYYNSADVLSIFNFKKKLLVRGASIFVAGFIALASVSLKPKNNNESTSSLYLKIVDGVVYKDAAKYSAKFVDYYPNGQVRSQGSYKEGLQEGDWEDFFPDGKPSGTFIFKNGKYNGTYRQYHHPDGSLSFESHYENDLQHGLESEFYFNGQKSSEQMFDKGLLNGASKQWDIDGSLQESGQFKKGKKDGVWAKWLEGVIYLEQTYKDGQLHGLSRTYDAEGRLNEEGNYHNGVKQGTWRTFDPQGNVTSVSEH
jgi:antitoxin component YwqK of YwqJK toxin-antitoxin module